jgi:hypothetical protein
MAIGSPLSASLCSSMSFSLSTASFGLALPDIACVVLVVDVLLLSGTMFGLVPPSLLVVLQHGPIIFLSTYLIKATPLLSYVVHLVLLIIVLFSSLPCYLYDAVLILTSDTLYSLIDTFLSI